jgi:serine protease Do
MADRKKGFLAGTVVGLGVAAAAAAGVGVKWPAAMAADAPLIKSSTAPIFAPPPGAPLSFADIFDRVAPAVVSIDVTTHLSQREMQQINPFQGLPSPFGLTPRGGDDDEDDQGDDQDQSVPRLVQPTPRGHAAPKSKRQRGPEVQASGSGFFISPEGYILTNNHVVENAETIKVTLNDKRELTAKVIGRDEGTDLAVLKVEGTGPFPYVNFEDRAKPRVGDWVLAIGNPLGLGGTATAGIVSTIARNLPDNSTQFTDYIQIDAPINRGNSGGPTFDIYGRVIGVNTAIYSPNGGSVGIGFDIPADVAASISKQLISGGKVTRGYLGVTIQNVGPDNADALGLKPGEGALITEVVAGGPGEKAGLRSGDIVLQVGDHVVTSNADLTRQVALAKAGDLIHLTVLRDGRRISVDVRSGVRPAESQLALNDSAGGDDQGSAAPDRPHATRPAVLGMTLAPLDDAARKRYSLGAGAHGVVIEGVKPDSEAAPIGFTKGDLIVRAGERAANTPEDVAAAVAEAKKAGRKGVFLLVAHEGRNIGLTVKFDSK